MARVLIGNWWALAIRGVFAIIFAVIAFVWPGITATVLVLMSGPTHWSTAFLRWSRRCGPRVITADRGHCCSKASWT